MKVLVVGVLAVLLCVAGVSEAVQVTGSSPLTVTGVTPIQIVVTAPTGTLPVGRSQSYTATALYANGASVDVTNVVTWASSAPSIANITIDGVATAVQASATPVQILAFLGTVAGSANLTVNSATLTGITVTTTGPTAVPEGVPKVYRATGTYSNGSTFDLTDVVTWASSAPSIATVTPEGLVKALDRGGAQITATFGGHTGSANLTVLDHFLLAIILSAPSGTIPAGISQQYTARGVFTDGSQHDLTPVVTWSAFPANVVTITPEGVVTALQGSASPAGITALYTVGPLVRTGSASLTVSFATVTGITVLAPQPSIPVGTTQQYTAFGTYSDGSIFDITHLVTWSSSAPSIAGITEDGLATGVQASATPVTIVASIDDEVAENNNPTAVLQATPTSGVAALTVSFNASQSSDPDPGDSIVAYTFNFGDGSPVVQQSTPTLSHVYTTPGTYVASLTVTDSHGNVSLSDSVQIVVSANLRPTAVLQATPTVGFTPHVVSFNAGNSVDADPGDSIVAYTFNFGDGSPVVQQSTPTITHVYSRVGTFVAILTVTDSHGSVSLSTQLQIVVSNRAPMATMLAIPNTGVAPLTVTLNASGSADPDGGDQIHQYIFTANGTSPFVSSTPTKTFVYTTPGTYHPTLKVKDTQGGESALVTLQIVVTAPNQAPTAVLQATPTSGVAPLAVSFSGAQSFDPDAGQSVVSYTFTFGDNSPVVQQSSPTIAHTYSAPGTYVATLKVTDSVGAQSTVTSVQVVVNNGVSITDVSHVEGNTGSTKVAFTVKLAAPSSSPVSVKFATRDGTGFAGKDYVATSGILSFPAGVTTALIAVPVIGETLFEANETFFVDIFSPVNAVITRATGRAVITNDDPSVGDTTMTPHDASVAVGERTTLAVTWTHPVSWRELETVDVRLVDGDDIALWVRFHHDDETDAVTFSIFNPASGKFGRPAAPGRPQRLESSWATLHLDESSVVGPPGKDVTLNLRISFKPRSAGHVFQVEAFATDDNGNQQGFDPVGTVTVRRR